MWEFAKYRYSAGEEYINYSSFRFNSTEEHHDVPFEACKQTDYSYKIAGNRKIYRIPEGKTEIDKVLVKTYPLDSIISKTPCVNAFITTDQFAFTPGNYQVYTTFNFVVKYGNQKSVTFKSNIFTIFDSQPGSVEEIKLKIKRLQKQIELLKLQLKEARSRPQNTASGPSQAPSSKQQPKDKDDEQPNDPTPPAEEICTKPVNIAVLGICL
jgi:hypothetical protein